MGVSISKNTVNSLVSDTQTILNNYSNICSVTGASANAQFHANGCTFKDSPVTVFANQNVSQNCISNNNIRSSIRANIQQQMQQTATAITQSFGFPSVSDAEDFINSSILLGNTIVDTFYNECLAQTANSNATFVCTNTTFDNSSVQIESFQQITQTCIQNNNTVNNIQADLVQKLSQTSLAKQENAFAGVFLVVIVIILIIAYGGISLAQSPIVQWGIVLIVLFSVLGSAFYTLTAKTNNNYPYNRT